MDKRLDFPVLGMQNEAAWMQPHVPQQEGQVGDKHDVRALSVSITPLTASLGTYRGKT